MISWRRWMNRPQDLFLRKAVFQVHLWSGIAVGAYVLVISLTGSVLVYRNELYRTFSPRPVVVQSSGESLTMEALAAAAARVYPDYQVSGSRAGETPNHAVDDHVDPRRGDEAAAASPVHGRGSGRSTARGLSVHGMAAGLARQPPRRRDGAQDQWHRRIGRDLALRDRGDHLVAGHHELAPEPDPGSSGQLEATELEPSQRVRILVLAVHPAVGHHGNVLGVSRAVCRRVSMCSSRSTSPSRRSVSSTEFRTWLAYLHFGRLGGRGIPGCGQGLCDSTTKAIWAVVGLVPTLMFVTGALMWWNRVVRPAARRSESNVRA